jgi:hypothetical protein
MTHRCTCCGRRTPAATALTPASGWELDGNRLKPASLGFLCASCAQVRPRELAADLRAYAGSLLSLAALVEGAGR